MSTLFSTSASRFPLTARRSGSAGRSDNRTNGAGWRPSWHPDPTQARPHARKAPHGRRWNHDPWPHSKVGFPR